MGSAGVIYGHGKPLEQRTAQVASDTEFHFGNSLLVDRLHRHNRDSQRNSDRAYSIGQMTVLMSGALSARCLRFCAGSPIILEPEKRSFELPEAEVGHHDDQHHPNHKKDRPNYPV